MAPAEMTLAVPLYGKPSVRALSLFAELVLIKRGLKKGVIFGVRGEGLERVFKVAEKATGESLRGLAYVKDAGSNGSYHICATSAWWLQCRLEDLYLSRAPGADRRQVSSRTVGKFCGFPACCIESYLARPEPVDWFLSQPGSSAFHIRKARGGYDQGSMVAWIPCSTTCRATWDYVRRARRILSRIEAFRNLPYPERDEVERAVDGRRR